MNDECERVGKAFFVLLKSCEDFCDIKGALVVGTVSVIVFETNKGLQYIDKHFTA